MIESVWKFNGIAELKYCKIERAAELLRCRLEDIFHWANTGKIQLCINVSDLPCNILFPSLANSESHDALSFLVKYMTAERPAEVIKEYFPSTYEHSLVSVHPDEIFDFHDKDDIKKIADILNRSSGYPFRIDGLWAIDGFYFGEDYLVSAPPVLGESVADDYSIMAKLLDILNFDAPTTTKDLLLSTSFSLFSPDHSDDEDFKAMVGVLQNPIILSVNNIYITKKQIEKIHHSGINGSWSVDAPDNSDKKVNTTVKQSTFTVALMRQLGFSDRDLQGSITLLRAKIKREIPGAIVPDDDKSVIDWLRKGGVQR